MTLISITSYSNCQTETLDNEARSLAQEKCLLINLQQKTGKEMIPFNPLPKVKLQIQNGLDLTGGKQRFLVDGVS